MKLVRILIIALGLMTIATVGAFAAVPFTTSSTLNQMAPNAQTGLAGTIQMTTLTGGSVLPNEIINISFNGAQISSLSNLSVTMEASGVVASASPTLYNTPVALAGGAIPGPPTVTVNSTSIVIAFPVAVTFVADEGIEIAGVRLNVSSFAVPGNTVNTTISSVLGSATVTNPSVPVAVFVEPITILTAPPASNITVAVFSTAGTVAVGTNPAVVNVRELFTNAFETIGSGTAATQLILRISNIPAGLTLSSATAVGSGSALIAVTSPATVAQTGGTATVTIPITAQDASAIETIAVSLTFAATAGATLPVGTATVAATLGPPATAAMLTNIAANINLAGVSPIPVGGTNPLRYANRFVPSPEVNILIVTQLTTQLLAVFNSWVPGSFDTGFAIANTTGFNTSTTQPLGAITGQAGTVTAVLYPADGSASKTITTSATVFGGTGGLDAQGQIPAHGTWTFLLSDLAKQAGFTTGFTGQVYFVVNASNAHGINYIADAAFQKSAQGYSMLVVPTPRSPAVPPATESLSF